MCSSAALPDGNHQCLIVNEVTASPMTLVKILDAGNRANHGMLDPTEGKRNPLEGHCPSAWAGNSPFPPRAVVVVVPLLDLLSVMDARLPPQH